MPFGAIPEINHHDSICGVSQLLKGPIGQVKVVNVTVAPQLLNLYAILDLHMTNAYSGQCYWYCRYFTTFVVFIITTIINIIIVIIITNAAAAAAAVVVVC